MSVVNQSPVAASSSVFDVSPSPAWPNGYNDSNTIRAEIEELSDNGMEVLLIGNSYSG